MNKAVLFIVSLIAVAVAIVIALFFQPDVASEEDIEHFLEADSVREPVDVVPIEYESTLYTTSKQHFYLSVPVEFSISQLDAGGVSQVFVENEDGEEQISIILAQSSTFEGVPILFDAWLQEELVTADYISTCENVYFGDVVGYCYRVTESGEEFVRYFGTADESTYFVVETRLGSVEEPAVVFLLRYLEFNPLHVEKEAEVIS